MSDKQSFFGKYRGLVANVIDPERRGRILVQVPAVYKDGVSGWAEPCLPLVGLRSGLLALPQLGASVWVEFEQGDPERPIWCGGFWKTGTAPSAVAPLQTVLQTASGHSIVLDDTPGVGGIKLTTLAGDVMQISPGKGALIQTLTGDKVEVSPSGITLQSSTGNRLVVSPVGIELSTAQGASIRMNGSVVMINNDGLMVT